MIDRITTYVRTKPRTSALIGLATVVGGAFLVWDAQRGGSFYVFLPLVACVAMHGLMHGGHGKHGHGHGQQAPEEPDAAPAALPETPVDRRDGGA